MKCNNCRCSEYIDSFDTCIENGHRHKVYICPICEDIYAEPLERKKKHYRFNKAKFANCVSIVITMLTIFGAVMYIGIHIDKFSTIM